MELSQIYTLLVNVAAVLAFTMPIRFLLAKHLGVDAKAELDQTDNAAFGVAIGGGVLGLMLMLTGVMSGEPMAVISEEILSLLVYGVLGSLLMIVGVLVQDKIVIRRVSLSDEIRKGNMAAALVVAVNMTVIGLIAKKTITWTHSDGLDGIFPVVVVFAVSQVVIALIAYLRMVIYAHRNKLNSKKGVAAADTWHGALKANNTAIALRYAGQLLATGIVIAATSQLVDSAGSLAYVALTWGYTAIALTMTVWIGYRLFLPLILFGINVVEEVDQQGNVGVAAVEAVLFIGVAFMVTAYFA